MQEVTLKVKQLPHCRSLPEYATAGSAGLDITAGCADSITVEPGKRVRVPTGLILQVPEGYEGQVRPRSGLAYKAGLSLTNCVGTIDSDFRGELMVLIINHGDKPYTIEPGERIAQLLITPVPRVKICPVDELQESQRGVGGFGSTGRLTAGSATN